MLRLQPRWLGLLLAAAWATSAAHAADDDELALVYGDQATLSIATGNAQSLRRAPAVASVITAEDIAAMGAIDLDEVLETVPGVHVARSANLYAPLYVMRGIYSQYNSQTLMLQNGVPMTTLLVGNRGNMWAGLPLENVARIEVIRGPGSALHGADAYAGVINIITKTAAESEGTQIGARAGSNGLRDGWLLHGGQWGAVAVAAYLRSGRTDGFKGTINADAQSRNDQLNNTHASLAPGSINVGSQAVDASVDLSYGQWRLRGGYKLRDDIGTGAGIAYALDPVGKAKSERVSADLSWADSELDDNWGGGFNLSFLEFKQRIPTPFRLYPAGSQLSASSQAFADGMIGAPESSERQVRVSAFATYGGFAGQQLRFGVGHDDLDMYETHELKNFSFSAAGLPVFSGPLVDYSTIAPFMLPQRRQNSYVYVQDEVQLAKDWTLTAGLRRDVYSDVGGTTNPRLALVWDAAYDLTAKLLYGQAFRAPSYNEVYSINNPVNRGNPGLSPETMRTLEMAFSWQSRRDMQVNVNFFRYTMQDIIRSVANPVAGTGSTFANTGHQNGKGMELETRWDISRELRLSANYAYQQSTDEATGKDAGYAPHHHLYGRADWRFSGDWQLSGQLNRVADRRRAAGDNRPAIADYTTVDTTVRNNVGKGQWGFAASIRNLFNAKVLEPSLAPGLVLPNDLPMAPRTFYVQASYAL